MTQSIAQALARAARVRPSEGALLRGLLDRFMRRQNERPRRSGVEKGFRKLRALRYLESLSVGTGVVSVDSEGLVALASVDVSVAVPELSPLAAAVSALAAG